jgi:hypothetical protein
MSEVRWNRRWWTRAIRASVASFLVLLPLGTVLGVSSPAQASPVINFDNLTAGVQLTNQYAGVTFGVAAPGHAADPMYVFADSSALSAPNDAGLKCGEVPVALELHRDHLPACRKGPEQWPEIEVDGQQPTVQQHERPTGTMRLVVELQAVHRCVRHARYDGTRPAYSSLNTARATHRHVVGRVLLSFRGSPPPVPRHQSRFGISSPGMSPKIVAVNRTNPASSKGAGGVDRNLATRGKVGISLSLGIVTSSKDAKRGGSTRPAP